MLVKFSNNPDIWRWSLVLLVGSAILYEATLTLVDVDLLGHLKFGLDILTSGHVASVDPYSFMTRGYAWLNHEWLSQAIFAFLFQHYGWASAVCFKAVIVTATIAILSWALINNRADAFTTSALILLAVFLLGPSIRTLRPHIFTLLALALLLFSLKQGKGKKQSFPLWFPLLFVVWPNLHGGFVAGLCTLGAWLVSEEVRQRREPSQRPLLNRNWIIFVLCCLAACINPYGTEMLYSVLKTQSAFLSDPGEISEWQPITITNPFGFAYILTLLGTIISVCVSRKKRDPTCLALWSIYALSPLLSIRHLALFSLATFILLGEHIGDLLTRRRSDTSGTNNTVVLLMAGTSLVVSIFLLIFAVKNTYTLEVMSTPPLDLPAKAVYLLKQVHAQGNIVCDLEWGEYIIWHLGPQLKVSIDGRTQVAYPPVVRLANRCFREGLSSWDIILEKFPVDFILIEKETASFNLMKLYPGWILVFDDDHSALFCPRSSRFAEQLLKLSKDSRTLNNLEPVFLNSRLP